MKILAEAVHGLALEAEARVAAIVERELGHGADELLELLVAADEVGF